MLAIAGQTARPNFREPQICFKISQATLGILDKIMIEYQLTKRG